MCIRDRSAIIRPLSVVLELLSDGVPSAIAKSIGFGSDGSNSNKLSFEILEDFAIGVVLYILLGD